MAMAAAPVTIDSGASWEEVAADRQKYRDASIVAVHPLVPGVPTDLPLNVSTLPARLLDRDEVEITEALPEEILARIATRKISVKQVAVSFLRRAGLAQKLTNCITELLPVQAMTRAATLDEYMQTHGKPIGPLHGLPISVKEHVGMKGLDLNAGFVAWVGKTGKDDAHILQILWDAGAVFYARTTQPQSLMHLETSSNLYGVTVNPFNTTLTSGGSSGGEGALLGIRGSCMGIGTDIGGSIRSPAACNGVYGFKPTSYRLPVAGWSATMAGQEQIVPCIGPLSTSLGGIQIFMKTLIAAKPWLKEPSLLPFEWRDMTDWWKSGNKKLKIAIMWEDGIVKPHPPITRALTEVVEKLKSSAKFELVDWKPYKHDLAWEIIANLYFSDGAAQEKSGIQASKEPYRPLTDFIITNNPHLQEHTITSMWASTVRREEYRTAYAELWNSTSSDGKGNNMVDVILCPATPSAAPKIDTARYWGYTAQWNLLDYPAVVFPVSKVGDVDTGHSREEYTPRNPKDKYNWQLWEKHGAEGYKNAPLSLQLVSRRYEDEKVLRALEVIKDEIGIPFNYSTKSKYEDGT